MCQLEYYHIAERLHNIKLDIKDLRENSTTTSIQEKIQILKKTNQLLREQNKLLTLRQEALAVRQKLSA